MGTSDNQLFARVFGVARSFVLELATPLRDALDNLGVGRNANGHQFGPKLEGLVQGILFPRPGEVPLGGLTVQGVPDPKQALLNEMFRGLGVEEGTAKRYADSLIAARAQFDDAGNRVGQGLGANQESRHWRAMLTTWRPVIFARGRATYQVLDGIHRDASQRYQGTERDVEAGAEQTIELLRRFPDLADAIYARAGLPNTQRFPPEPKGAVVPGSDDARFQARVKQELDEEWWSGLLCTAGLAVVAIGLTVFTGGILGPAAAALVGMGLGTAQGGVLVYNRAAAVQEGRVAVTIGAMDPATLRQLEGQLDGAWGMLAVDIVSGGVLGRFGGTTALSAALRGTAISGAAGGVRSAMDPAVWNSEDRAGMIMQGVVVGAAVGVAGSAVGAGLAASFRAGSPIQVALDKLGGVLRPGRRVRIAAGAGAEPVDATVVSANANGAVQLQLDGGPQVGVRVDRVIHLWMALRRNPQLGSGAVPRPQALLQKFPVTSQGHWRDRTTNAAYTEQMSLAVDTLLERIRNGTVANFQDALRLMGAQTWKVNRRIARSDMGGTLGIPGKLRTPDGRANMSRTGVDEAYAPVARARMNRGDLVANEGGMKLTATLGMNGNPVWYHTEARSHPQIRARLDVLWNEIMAETRHPVVVRKVAEFHYYFAHLMPYERGSAGAADAITKALFELKGFRVGAWREGIAADREALVLPLADFVRNYPAYFE